MTTPSVATRPLVSVLLPSYNHERFVEEAVRSVWTQTYPNVELVVVDDGSRDGSPALLRALQAHSPIPMRLLVKENEGVSRTMNRAFSLASGEYIVLMASDDRLLPHHVETLVGAFQQAPPETGMVYADMYRIDEEGRRCGVMPREGAPPSGWIFEDLLLRNVVVYGHAALVRSDAFRAAGGFNESSRIDDWELQLRIARRHQLWYVPAYVAEYRVHTQGHLNRQTDSFVADWLRLFDEMTRGHPTLGRGWRARHARARLYLMIGQNYYTTRELGKARHWLARSLAAFPLHGRPWMLMVRSLLGRGLLDRVSGMRHRVPAQSHQS